MTQNKVMGPEMHYWTIIKVMLVKHHKEFKGLVCTELVEMSGRSEQAGLAGWGSSVCQPFICGLKQHVQLHRQHQQKSFLHIIITLKESCCVTLAF